MTTLHPRWEEQFLRRSQELADPNIYTDEQIKEAMHVLGEERAWHVEYRRLWHRLAFFLVGAVGFITAGIYELAWARAPLGVSIFIVALGCGSMVMIRECIDDMAEVRVSHDCLLVDHRIEKNIKRKRWRQTNE